MLFLSRQTLKFDHLFDSLGVNFFQGETFKHSYERWFSIHRMEMMKRADLVAALRLPNNAFTDNAGTDAGRVLIILQKHTDKKALSADEKKFT